MRSTLLGAEHAEAPSTPRAKVRPAAITVLTLAAAGAAWFLLQYLAAHAAGAATSDTPPLALALALGAVAVMSLAVAIFRPEYGGHHAMVATSVAWLAALLAALVLAWSAVFRSDRMDGWHGVPVTSAAEVDAYLAQNFPAGIDPIRIPTGVLVQSVEFLSGDNVQVTGYVWQRFGPDVPEELTRGVVFAEAIKEAYDAKEVYRYEDDGIETIGWYFAATLRPPFAYAEFPFDEQDVWLRLWSRDFSQRIVLVPVRGLRRDHPERAAGDRARVRLQRLDAEVLRVQLHAIRKVGEHGEPCGR